MPAPPPPPEGLLPAVFRAGPLRARAPPLAGRAPEPPGRLVIVPAPAASAWQESTTLRHRRWAEQPALPVTDLTPNVWPARALVCGVRGMGTWSSLYTTPTAPLSALQATHAAHHGELSSQVVCLKKHGTKTRPRLISR